MARILIYLISLIFGLIELIIGLRIILSLLRANPSTPFVKWVNEISNSLVYPFQGIFPSLTLPGGFALETSAVIALLVYAVIAYIISEAISFIASRSTSYTNKTKVIHEE